MKPATSTRRNADTSIFAAMGVSIGTSKKLVQAVTDPSSTRLTIVATLRAVIDFFEEVVILPDQHVLRFERDRLVVCLPGFFELSLVLVRNRQVVPGSRVCRV